MIRNGFRIVTAVLAVVGFGTVLLLLLGFALDGGSMGEADGATFVTSPNGSFKAVLTTWTSGGAISPYCYDRLTVVPVGVPTDKTSASDMAVFEAECATFALRDGMIENSPSITWEGDEKLKVKFSISGSALEPATVKLRKQDASGRIAVGFEVQP
ncbi:hypothetical protein CO666_21530 [Rhizobium chutanense]|uniref:Uncharacterized protein n=2 Tax=Rhizobium chutanense TaxID=2035448 RepID=A0A2A6J7Q6_9HYPH|nr:hypothetical protein CO666_21530 [Rhizobium chutanense]